MAVFEFVVLWLFGGIISAIDGYFTIINIKYSQMLNQDKELRESLGYEEEVEYGEANEATKSMHNRFGLDKGQLIKYLFNIIILGLFAYATAFHIGKIGYFIFGLYTGIILRQSIPVWQEKRRIDKKMIIKKQK